VAVEHCRQPISRVTVGGVDCPLLGDASSTGALCTLPPQTVGAYAVGRRARATVG
jgi:hypothetical protein